MRARAASAAERFAARSALPCSVMAYNFFAAALLEGGVAELFQHDQGRVNDTWTGRIAAGKPVFYGLDDVVAVAGLLRDQRQDDPTQLTVIERPQRSAASSSPFVAFSPMPAALPVPMPGVPPASTPEKFSPASALPRISSRIVHLD